MEFGRVDRVNEIDFTLPADDVMTDRLLASLLSRPDRREDLNSSLGPNEGDKPGLEDKPNLYVGCAKWGRKDWIGKVYPKGTKDKDFLAHYVKQFNCIELNALFYNLQPKAVIERWASLADKGFRFCPKFTNTISHFHQLKNADLATDQFIDHMQSFGDKLGPAFLQLSDAFAPNRSDILEHYLRGLPRDFSTCLELRHESWFTGQSDSTWQLLRELGVGAVITDTSGRRDCLHMKLTAPIAFIRFVGNNLDPTDFKRIDAWVERIKVWIGRGLREIYFFIHNHEEVNSPPLCKYAITQFNERCGLNLKPPNLLNGNDKGMLSLF